MKYIIATKLEMSQRFKDDGTVVPVTLLQAGPCEVTQVRTMEKDGYDAVQVGFGLEKRPTKAEAGHFKANSQAFKTVHEFRAEAAELGERKVGDKITAEEFTAGQFVNVIGTSKGKGFQGVVKRHHFRGGPASHGHKDNLRMPGSIGSGGIQRVFKGLKMGGRMGGEQVTVKNLEVVDVDAKAGVIAVKGAVPGPRGAVLFLTGGFAKKQSWTAAS